MARKTTILGMMVVVSIALLIVHAWAEPQINPGKWEITTTTEMAGMAPQTATHTQCITTDNLVPMSEDANQECQVTDITTQGNTVSWKITCGGKGGNKMSGTGSATYNGDSMHGTMSMTVEPYGTKINNTLSGRRIGACDGQAATTTSQAVTQQPQESSEAEEPVAVDDSTQAPQESCEAQETTTEDANTQESQESSKVGETIAEDAKDVGQAAKDEAKDGVIDEVRTEVRDAIKKLFE